MTFRGCPCACTHRGLYEFGPETTAYLVLNELELLSEEEAAVSRGYVQGWLEGDRPPDAAIRKVFTATDMILQAGRQDRAAVANLPAPDSTPSALPAP